MKPWSKLIYSLGTVSIILITGYSLAATVDLRTKSDSSGEYEVGFCARPSPDTIKHLPGHAFVSFSFKAQDGNRRFLAIGHTVQGGVSPTSAAWSYFGEPVRGFLSEEKYTSAMETCLIATVNRQDYENALNLTKNPLASIGIGSSDTPVLQAYNLGLNDCLSFMIKVANLFVSKGLTVPRRGANELPLHYMQRFIEANSNA